MMTRRGCRTAAIAVAGAILLLGGAARASICGWCVNSATVGDGIVFDELNANGDYTRPGGPRILRKGVVVMADGTKAKLQVKRHFLSAVSLDRKKTYTYDELVGMTFAIGMDDGREYQIKLDAVKGCLHKRHGYSCKDKKDPNHCQPLRFWTSPHDEIPQYDFKVMKTSIRTKPALPAPTATPAYPEAPKPSMLRPRFENGKLVKKDDAKYGVVVQLESGDREVDKEFKEHLCRGEFTEQDELWEDLKYSAIVFEGDHYDPEKKTVSKSRGAGWFNLACFGAAPAKMHLLRHTAAGAFTSDGTNRNTSLPERTAMLKAITADYCGNGAAWTGDGTPLEWMDAREWHPKPNLDVSALTTSGMIEAVWGPKGALCLNEPRRKTSAPPTAAYPACTPPAVTRDEVKEACQKLKRKFDSGPPAAGTSPPKTPDIPRCDAAWATYWPKAKLSVGRVHVVSANVTNPANFCDLPATTP
jgi:hypothetical protein